MSFADLVDAVRARLQWKKEDGWLASANSGSTVPFSWTVVELCRLLGAYPGGISVAATVSELQRKWNENNHPWGRNQAGVKGSLAVIKQSGSVPLEGVLELQFAGRRDGDGRDAWIFTMRDFHGHFIEWYVPQKMADLGSAGLLVPDATLVRLTGLRVMPCRDKLVLLPTDCFTVLLRDAAALDALKEGHVLARVRRVHPRKDVRAAVAVRLGRHSVFETERMHSEVEVDLDVLTDPPKRGVLVLRDDQLALAMLFKSQDVVVIREPLIEALVRREPYQLAYRYGADTVVFQCPADPVSAPLDSQAAGVADNLHRAERVTLVGLPRISRNSTVLVRVTRAPALMNTVGPLLLPYVQLDVVDDVDHDCLADSAPLAVYCWDRCRIEAARLHAGQLVLLCNVKSKPRDAGGGGAAVRLDVDGGGNGCVLAVPMRGWLASPDLWQPASRGGGGLRGGGMIVGAVLVKVQAAYKFRAHAACGRRCDVDVSAGATCTGCGERMTSLASECVDLQAATVVLDTGLQQWVLECAPHVAPVLVRAEPGSQWDVYVLRCGGAGIGEPFMVLECLASHATQRCSRLLPPGE